MRASDPDDFTGREPAEQVDPVDPLVDERPARHLTRIREPSRRAGAVPILGDRPSADVMQQDDVADVPRVDPRLDVRASQPADALERQARHAGGFDRLDHAIGLGQVHRHRLAEDDVLTG
jgi:hypothetical protein